MKTYPDKYRYRVCPYCRSKNIRRAFMQTTSSWKEEFSVHPPVDENGDVTARHYFCNNCKRVTYESYTIWMYDRKEMKRDIKRLLEFLQGD